MGIAKIKEILTEKEVDFSNLSDKAIKKLQSEWDLKREMAELGIDTSKPNSDTDNGATLSTRRPRRTRNANVSYLSPPKMKFEESDSEEDDNENADGDEKKEAAKQDEEVEEESASSDEDEEVYEPSDESEEEEYEMD